jgi:hypothetical protein
VGEKWHFEAERKWMCRWMGFGRSKKECISLFREFSYHISIRSSVSFAQERVREKEFSSLFKKICRDSLAN